MLDDRAPKDEHVDPRIAAASGGVLWHGERRGNAARSPGLNPRQPSRLEFGDDLVGDFLIEARPVLAGASVNGRCDIAGLRDGRREPLSRS